MVRIAFSCSLRPGSAGAHMSSRADTPQEWSSERLDRVEGPVARVIAGVGSDPVPLVARRQALGGLHPVGVAG